MSDSKVTASHILIMHKDSDNSRSKLTKDDASKVINDLFSKLKKDPKIFKDIANQKSDCPSSSSGGFLGEFGKGVMVKEFEEAAFKLQVGEISEPIETDFGFHIIFREK